MRLSDAVVFTSSPTSPAALASTSLGEPRHGAEMGRVSRRASRHRGATEPVCEPEWAGRRVGRRISTGARVVGAAQVAAAGADRAVGLPALVAPAAAFVAPTVATTEENLRRREGVRPLRSRHRRSRWARLVMSGV